jgi:hypothetical protein
VTLVAILDADKEGFLRSAWSLIQMVGRAARNVGGEVVMYADSMTDSMKAAIGETDRRRAVQARYNEEHGIVPATIVKGIRDLNDQLRTVAEGTIVYSSEREAREARLAELDRSKVEELIRRMEAEMRAAAKELEFERAAALRDEIQQIRLRVLEQDQSVIVAQAAERAAALANRAPASAAARARGGTRGGGREGAGAEAPAAVLEVASVEVLPAPDEPLESLTEPGMDGSATGGDGDRSDEDLAGAAIAEGTAADWLPGIRDEHDDAPGWQARWTERPTWDRTVTPNIRRRQGTRPPRRRR